MCPVRNFPRNGSIRVALCSLLIPFVCVTDIYGRTLRVGGCGTFYAIEIESEVFKGLSVVKQHKLVSEALKQEIEGMHGLQVSFSPGRILNTG